MMTPIFQMLKNYRDQNPLPFHMPGHILGRGITGELKDAGSLDITEIPGSDCLHQPRGVISEAQQLAADCFGADYTLFLVNGSTSGIHAMLQATLKPGEKLIIGRDCHQSVLNALALMNAEPVFVNPQMDHKNQIPLGVNAAGINEALIRHPDSKGILVTRPNYFGVAQALDGIVEISKLYKIPLLIDEAHGAHFKFHNNFPSPALEKGADLCVQSLHKTLPALTQTALLHAGKNCIPERRKIEAAVSMVQTTSPSYLLMASIDMTRYLMENEGRDLYKNLWDNIEEFNVSIRNTNVERVAGNYSGCDTDFSRIVLSFKNTSLSGYQAEELLRARYGIVAEMADLQHVVLIATPFHTHEDFNKLLNAISEVSVNFKQNPTKPCFVPQWPQMIPERVISAREALFGSSKEIPIYSAKGEVCSASVVPYPPGIPLLNPGERITQDAIDYLQAILQLDGSVHGIRDNMISVISSNN